MTNYVALLRGINVGGRHTVTMSDLRGIFASMGADEVVTHIQSGNVIFGHQGAPPGLTSELQHAIEAATGFGVPVTLRTAPELDAVVARPPFPTTEPTRLHVAFLDSAPGPGAFASVEPGTFLPEQFASVGREVYLHLPDGMARTKLPRALGLYTHNPATIRNWRTVVALRDLVSGR